MFGRIICRTGPVAVSIAACLLAMWVSATSVEARSRGRTVIGIGLGLAALSAISQSSESRGYRSRSRHGKSYASRRTRGTQQARKRNSSSKVARHDASRKSSRSTTSRAPRDIEPSIESNQSVEPISGEAPGPDQPIPATPPSLETGATTALKTAVSDPKHVRMAQERLKSLGYEVTDASGEVDLQTRIAIMRFQDQIGHPANGQLTEEQLLILLKPGTPVVTGSRASGKP